MNTTSYPSGIHGNNTTGVFHEKAAFGLDNIKPSLEFIISNIALAVLILIGNVFVCLVFRVDRRIRKHTNNLVISLVVCDILVAVIYIPVYLHDSTSLQRDYVQYVISFIWIASILNHSALAFDRYQGVMRPLHYETVMTPQKVRIILFIVWFIPAVNTSLPIPLMNTSLLSEDNRKLFVKYFISCNLLIILTGVLLIFSVYITILCVARKHAYHNHKQFGRLYPMSLISGEITGDNSPCFITRWRMRLMKKNFKADLKLAKLFFAVVATHLVCWLPTIYVNVCEQLIYPEREQLLIKLAPIELIYAMYYAFISISVLNPLVFAIFREEFRDGCRKLLGISRRNDLSQRGESYYCQRMTRTREESTSERLSPNEKEIIMKITCL